MRRVISLGQLSTAGQPPPRDLPRAAIRIDARGRARRLRSVGLPASAPSAGSELGSVGLDRAPLARADDSIRSRSHARPAAPSGRSRRAVPDVLGPEHDAGARAPGLRAPSPFRETRPGHCRRSSGASSDAVSLGQRHGVTVLERRRMAPVRHRLPAHAAQISAAPSDLQRPARSCPWSRRSASANQYDRPWRGPSQGQPDDDYLDQVTECQRPGAAAHDRSVRGTAAHRHRAGVTDDGQAGGTRRPSAPR